MITIDQFNIKSIDPSWQAILNTGLATMNQDYLQALLNHANWLPGKDKLFNAFSLPKNQVRTILLGESPYPRPCSANGFAFWDAAVDKLWSNDGLSKPVNRATSLRNLIKMLLVADERLSPDNTSQEAIARLDKRALIETNNELFQNFLRHGFLLFNTTPVLTDAAPAIDAKAWQPFLDTVLRHLLSEAPETHLILLGRIAKTVEKSLPHLPTQCLIAEHPYNLSFITHPVVLDFFKPLCLLRKNKYKPPA